MGCENCIERGKLKNKLFEQAKKLAKDMNEETAVYYNEDKKVFEFDILSKVEAKIASEGAEKFSIHSIYSQH